MDHAEYRLASCALAVSDIAVRPDKPDTIFIATGDPNWPLLLYKGEPGLNNAESYMSRGVFRSVNGGSTWSAYGTFQDTTGNAASGSQISSGTFWSFPSRLLMGEMIINQSDPNLMFFTMSSYYEFDFDETGYVYRSIDGGVTWKKVLKQRHERFRSIEFHPTDPDIIYAAGRSVWRSTDGGVNWINLRSNGLLAGINDKTDSRCVISVTPDEPDFLWVLTFAHNSNPNNPDSHYFYLSTDSGNSFSLEGGHRLFRASADKPYIRYAITAHPSDYQKLVFGSGNVSYASDITTNRLNSFPNTHDDVHSLEFAPTGEFVYAGTDGGIFVSDDNGASWSFKGNGIATHHVNAISSSQSFANKVLIGSHDVGTNLHDELQFSADSGWGIVYGGDGARCYIDFQNDSIMYQSDYQGQQNYINRTKTSFIGSETRISDTTLHPKSYQHQNFVLDPQRPNKLYLGNRRKLRSNDNYGQYSNWYDYSDLTSLISNSVAQIYRIEVSKSNTDVIWLLIDNAPTWGGSTLERVFKTTDGGQNWTDIVDLSGTSDNPLNDKLKWMQVRDIEIFPTNPDIVVISFSGNSRNSTEYIAWTTDGGATWHDSITGIASGVNKLLFDKSSMSRLFAGTDFGVYHAEDFDSIMNFSLFGSGLPNCQIKDLEIDYCRKKLLVGTYCRGVWEVDIENQSPGSPTVISSNTILGDDSTYIHIGGNLIVESGNTLTIKGTVAFSAESKLIVERGAKLIIEGGTLTSFCGDHWTGIEVWGNRNEDQFPVLSNTDQGLVQLNNAVIENARTAISTGKFNPSIDWNYTGGIILAVNSTFRNCRRAIEYLSYRNTNPANGAHIGNAGRIVSCSLLLDNGFYNPGNQDVSLVTLYDVDGVRFIGNTFLNQTDNDMKHNAIYADNAGFSVENKFNISSTVSNQFSNFNYAIKSHGFNSFKFVKIDGCNFNYNFRSVYVSGQLFPRITNNSINLPQLSGEYEGDGAYGIYIHDSRGYRVEGNDILGQFDPQGTGPSFVKTEIGTYTTSSGSFGNMIYKNSINGAKVSNAARYDNSGLRYFCNEMSNYKYAIASYETGIHVFQGNCGTEGGEDAANTFDHGGDKDLRSQSPYVYFYRNSSPYTPATFDNPVTITVCTEGVERDCPHLLESFPVDPGGDYDQSKTEANGILIGIEEATADEAIYLMSEFFNQYSLASTHALSITDTIDSLEIYTPAYASLLSWYDSIKEVLDTILPVHVALAQLISDPSEVRNLLNEYDSTYGGFTKEIRLIEIHHYLDSSGLDTLDAYAETELTDIANEYSSDTIVDDEAGYIGAKNMLRYFKSQSYEEPVVPLPGEQSARLKKPESDSSETEGITFTCRPNPFGSLINISISMEDALPGAQVSVVNMLGKQIWFQKLGNEKEMEFQVDLSGYADGTYICTFRNGDRILKAVKLAKTRR